MIKMVCDRCNKEIEGTTYYMINIYADDINPNNSKCDWMTPTLTAVEKSANAFSVFNGKPQYCKKCRDEIEAFINKKE